MTTPLEEFVLEELSCPACYNYMCPPINQCLEGHNMCHDCFGKISNCPKCRAQKSFTARNYALEAIFRIVNIPCSNQYLGCNYECAGDLIKHHQKYCRFTKKKCPFTQYDNCHWKDSTAKLRAHLMLSHDSNFYQKEKQKFVSQNFKSIKSYHYIFAVIYVYGNFFRLTWEINESTKMTRWAVYFMGAPEEAQNFYYKLEITQGSDTKPTAIPLTFKSVCDAKPEKDGKKFGDHNCFYIHKMLLDKYCEPNGNLNYKVSVYPVEIFQEALDGKKDNSNTLNETMPHLAINAKEECRSDLAILFMVEDY